MTVSDVLDVMVVFDSALSTFFGVLIAAWLTARVIVWFGRIGREYVR